MAAVDIMIAKLSLSHKSSIGFHCKSPKSLEEIIVTSIELKVRTNGGVSMVNFVI